jgi:hypothetical protein
MAEKAWPPGKLPRMVGPHLCYHMELCSCGPPLGQGHRGRDPPRCGGYVGTPRGRQVGLHLRRDPATQPPCGAVVQLVRIPACHAGGRGFEPRPLRHQFKSHRQRWLFLWRAPPGSGPQPGRPFSVGQNWPRSARRVRPFSHSDFAYPTVLQPRPAEPQLWRRRCTRGPGRDEAAAQRNKGHAALRLQPPDTQASPSTLRCSVQSIGGGDSATSLRTPSPIGCSPRANRSTMSGARNAR